MPRHTESVRCLPCRRRGTGIQTGSFIRQSAIRHERTGLYALCLGCSLRYSEAIPRTSAPLAVYDEVRVAMPSSAARSMTERLRRFAELTDTACTFYVRDPGWPSNYLMMAYANLRVPEAVHGVGVPLPDEYLSEDAVFVETASTDLLCRRHSPLAKQLLSRWRPGGDEKFKLFGNFVIREDVCSRAWFFHRNAHREPDALLAVNYRVPKSVWTPLEQASLRDSFLRASNRMNQRDI